MTCQRRANEAKLKQLIDIIGIDSVCIALGLEVGDARAMRDGAVAIDAETEILLNFEVQKLEAAGLWVEMVETLTSGSDDVTAAVTETTDSDVGHKAVEDSPEALRGVVEGVLRQVNSLEALGDLETDKPMSNFERALLMVLGHRLELELRFRQPVNPVEDMSFQSAASEQKFVSMKKAALRRDEKLLKNSRGRFHLLKGPFDLSGEDLYRKLVVEYCQAREIDSGLALSLGLENIGRHLYPEKVETSGAQWRRLNEEQRLNGAALLEAIQLAEEVEFRSPLLLEEKRAAQNIKLRMELMLIMELAITPPSYTRDGGLLALPDERRRLLRQMVETGLGRLRWIDGQKQNYGGSKGAANFFNELIEKRRAKECRVLAGIMDLDMAEQCRNFLSGKGPLGYFDSGDVRYGRNNRP